MPATAGMGPGYDGKTNYDTLVFFDTTRGITAGPFHAPSTGTPQAGQ